MKGARRGWRRGGRRKLWGTEGSEGTEYEGEQLKGELGDPGKKMDRVIVRTGRIWRR